MITCPNCGSEVPDAEFCGVCGAHLPSGSAGRRHAFAASPGEHVLQPNVVSALFPHLPQRHSTHVRVALLVILLVLAALGIARLTGSAIALAACAVPLLYLLYIYEVQVYGDEPWLVVGCTFGLGLFIGIPWALITGPIVHRAVLVGGESGLTPAAVLVPGILLPLIAQALMLVGPLILYILGHHREPLDGFTFGVASALGFTLSTTLIELSPELRGTTVTAASPLGHALLITGRGLLVPFLNASTTGLIAGALWLRRVQRRAVPLGWLTSLPATIAAACLVRIGLGTADILALRLGLVVTVYLVIGALLLIWVRLDVHAMLLAEARDIATGPEEPCPNCGRLGPVMQFCVHCGIARQATSRYIRSDSGVRQAGRPNPGRRWAGLAAVLVLAMVAATGVAVARSTPAHAPCGPLCAPPPPPCVTNCPHAMPGVALAGGVYTSSAYGFTVRYPDFTPSRQDDRSLGWDLSDGNGQYSIDVVAGSAGGRTAERVLHDIVSANFPDYSYLYHVPGAELGYNGGAGAVYNGESSSFFGSVSESRVAVLTSTRGGLAIAVVGAGDAAQSSSDHPDPSGLPVSSFIDSVANGIGWP